MALKYVGQSASMLGMCWRSVAHEQLMSRTCLLEGGLKMAMACGRRVC